ncbi:hypothetical protein [Streptomyces sp. NPDC001933]|uniref:hypothetical protein n=1 Tax=Streptomyces sp. NPDC001933 TaxID=3364626 RepID=UPI0036B965AD
MAMAGPPVPGPVRSGDGCSRFARDAALARHMYLFAARLIGPLRFLSPVALTKALVVSVEHRGANP